jgi:outer membrane protein OmpA-like peptidoglycan-associated protein
MLNSHRTFCLGEASVARLASDLDRRQAALNRFGANGIGRYQGREIEKSIREMLKSVSVKVPFRTGSHALESHLKQELVKLADALRCIPAVSIDIEAHTDVRGSRRFNRKLAFERARAVRQVFLMRGVPLGRITTRALGVEAAVYRKGDRGGYAFDRQAIVRLEVEEIEK